MANVTTRRYGEIVRVIFSILGKHQDGLAARQVLELAATSLTLDDHELGNYESSEEIRFYKIARFATIAPTKAGWMQKAKGTWRVTPEGLAAISQWLDPEEFQKQAKKRYYEWFSQQPARESTAAHEPDESGPENDVAITFEKAEETAWGEIEQYLKAMPPYEFQDCVADLLKAMGYFVSWVAPPGKDGGIDIIGHTDPLGARAPRIKVQVKRMSSRVDVATLKSFIAVVNGDDLGLYVSTGGFTKDAEEYARSQEHRKITLIDIERLVELWIKHYDKLDDYARRRLPLTPIYFLTPPL